jgi:hypothetical protein
MAGFRILPIIPHLPEPPAQSLLESQDMSSSEELLAEIAKLKAENEALKKPAGKGVISFRISEKGAVSVYGLGRFPVTLYKEQWEKLLGRTEDLRQFIKDNDANLKKKEA